jgi:glucokinase
VPAVPTVPALPARRLSIGVDVGGTKVLAVLLDRESGEVRESLHAPAGAAGPEVVDNIVAAVAELVRRAGMRRAGGGGAGGGGAGGGGAGAEPADAEVIGVGLGLAGFVGNDGLVRSSANAPGLVGIDVAGVLHRRLGLPVVVDNDANCAAAAALARRAPPVRHLVAVTLGTGIGAGLVVDGKVVRGARGFAGEPGHMVVDPDGPLCPCGRRGCWERYASGAGLSRITVEMLGPGAFGQAPAGEDVTAAAAAGDAGARRVMARFAGWVGMGVANLIVLLDPEVVVLGGGVVADGDLLLPLVREAVGQHPPVAGRGVPIEAVPGGPAAGAIGAAMAVR